MKVRQTLQILIRLSLCFGVNWTVTSGDMTTTNQRIAPGSVTEIVTSSINDQSSVFDGSDAPMESDAEGSNSGSTSTGLDGMEVLGSGPGGILFGGSWKWKFSWGWLPILQIVVAFVGITGNLLVVLAVVRRRSSHVTDILIGALAAADLMASVFFIPVPIAIVVPDTVLGAVYCKIVFPYFYRWICLIASAYTLVVMSFERMVAVAYPFRFTRIFSTRNVGVLLSVIWVASPLMCVFFLTLEVKNGRCVPNNTRVNSLALNIATLTFRLLVPGTLMIVTQVITVISLNRQSRRLRGAVSSTATDAKRPTFHVKARNRVIQMLFGIVAIFLLSWSPVQVTWLLMILGYIPRSPYVRDVGNLITYINTMANPFIYAARYPKFRAAVKEIFSGVKELRLPLFKDPSNDE